MSNAYKCITNLNKVQLQRSFISFKSFYRNSCIAHRKFIHNKLSQVTPCKIGPIHVQTAVNVSTSRVLLSDIETMSEGDKNNFNVDYNDILKAQSDHVLIIDVREQSEIDETGKLPGSIHIPMGDVANTLRNLSEKDFKDKFAREKPLKDTKIILSCRSGRRSAMVQEEIRKLGYENAYNYIGGWLDWESNQKI